MTTQQPNPPPRFTPDRKVVVWTWVKSLINQAGPDTRGADANKLVQRQIDSANGEGGKP